MSGFDGNHVFTVSVHDPPPAASTDSPSQTEKLLLEFLLQYRVGGEFIYRSLLLSTGCLAVIELSYRDQLRANLLLKQYQLEVDLRHVGLYNDELAHAIQDRPADILPLVSTILFGVWLEAQDWISLRMQLLKQPALSCSH
jgi:DNA replication licensing factor MCM5